MVVPVAGAVVVMAVAVVIVVTVMVMAVVVVVVVVIRVRRGFDGCEGQRGHAGPPAERAAESRTRSSGSRPRRSAP